MILVAEDDPTSQRPITRLLQANGYNVVVVENGDDALWALGLPDAPSLVVLDWLLPGMDGIEVCHRVRERNPDVPPYILMVTDSTDPARLAEGYQAGVNDFLRKPFDQQELRMRVRIGRQAARRQPLTATDRVSATSAATDASTLEDTCLIHPGSSSMGRNPSGWNVPTDASSSCVALTTLVSSAASSANWHSISFR